MSVAEREQRRPPTWPEIRSELEALINARDATAWGRWFEAVTGLVKQGANDALTLRVVCPTKFHADWLQDNYTDSIHAVWRQFEPEGPLIFSVQEKKGKAGKGYGEVVQFPLLFPAETRPVSNDLVRCALFAAVQGKDRQHFKDFHKLASFGETEVWLMGYQFNQEDHDSFAQMVFLAQHKPLGEEVRGSFRAFVAGLGKGYGSNARQAAAKSVERIVTNSIKIHNKRTGLSYLGHLVNDGILPSDRFDLPRLERDFTYQINPKLAPYFASGAFTLVDWEQRLSLKQQELAKWLHLWLTSNAEYYPTKVETIREKCGSQAKSLRHFREQLREALKTLEETGVIKAWYIEKKTDLVQIETKPSPAQQRHLAKAKKRPK